MALTTIIEAFKKGRNFTSDSPRVDLALDNRGIVVIGDDADYFMERIMGDKGSPTERAAFYAGAATHPVSVSKFLYERYQTRH